MSPRCARFGIACVLRPVALPLLLLLAACDEGSVSLAVTDAPADEVEAVVVQFVAVEFRNSEGDWERVEFDRDLQVDLLALRGSAQTLIRDESIPAAQYTAIRFEIEADGDTGESYVDEDDGSRIALELAAGQDSKPTVDYRFNLDEGDEISLTVDFDLRRSLREPENFDDPYLLESFLRAVEDERTGTLRGSVSNDLLGSGCEAALYVFEGQDAEPDDLGGANEPLTSQALVIDNGSVSVSYEIAFLEAGDYTLALTCEAEDDELDEDDDLSFRRERNFEIEEGEVTELDLD